MMKLKRRKKRILIKKVKIGKKVVKYPKSKKNRIIPIKSARSLISKKKTIKINLNKKRKKAKKSKVNKKIKQKPQLKNKIIKKAKLKTRVKIKRTRIVKAKRVRTKKVVILKPKKQKKKIVKKLRAKTLNQVKIPKTKELPKEQVEKKPTFSSSGFIESFKPKIKVIGIGGGGGSIVSEIGRSLDKATFVIADTDVRSFKKRKGIKNFIFGQDLTRGLGTGLNIDLAKEAALREKEKIYELFNGQDIVIFVACLGGGLGSGATLVFLDVAKNFKGITLGIFTLPFKFEGKSKHRIAAKALGELRKSLNVSITIPNERIFKIIDENTPIVDAFSMVNKSLIESLESLIDLIQSPGLINIDFADLRAILQGKGNLAFLNTAEASGKEKADVVIKNVLHNSLYHDNFIPEKVLFNIEGGKNLSMFEVDKISKAISDRNPRAKIIFGISKNSKYKNKIKTTLLMTGPTSLRDLESDKESAKSLSEKAKSHKKKLKNQSGKKAKERLPSADQERSSSILSNLIPSFGPTQAEPEEIKRISIAEKPQNPKKTIRRTALEIQRDEESERRKKSKQEEEWDIPAFLRFKKVK